MCKCNFITAGTKSTTFPVQLGYSSMLKSIMYRRLLRNFAHIGRHMWQIFIEFNLRPQLYSVYFTAPIVTELKFGQCIWCTSLLRIFSIANKKWEIFHLNLALQQYWRKPNLLNSIVVLHAHEIRLSGQLFAKSPTPNFLENLTICLADDTRSRVEEGRNLSPH